MVRLLLVDDDRDSLLLRKLIFERLGHEVFTACGVIEAREQFAEARPDTVILDLRLPLAADGLALIREFRAAGVTGADDAMRTASNLTALRIVVLSGWTQDLVDTPEFAMVDEVFAKPIHTSALVKAVSGA